MKPDRLCHPFALDGKVALVTGGGRGIGEAIVEAFARAGARVLVANRTASAGDAVAARLRGDGLEVDAVGCDIGAADEPQRLVDETLRRFDALDIVVHNAAVNHWGGLDAIDEETLEHTLAVNLKACFRLARAALPPWRARGGGRMLVTSSVTGPRVAMPGSAAYAASKAGVNGFIRSAALDLAPLKVTVNGVEPGYIAKQGGSLLSDPARARRLAAHIPAGELGRPDDIAGAMHYLASDAARYVTGQTIVVDGGSTLPESPSFNEDGAAL